MDLGLSGKRAIVTGGSRGIGLAIARTLLAEGAHIGICARDEHGLQLAADDLAGTGAGRVISRALDVADSSALTSFIDDTAAALGGLDILVVSASAMTGKGRESWSNSFNVDLMSLVNSIEAAVPHFEAAGGGSIVAIATTSALEAGILTTNNSYAALKAAAIQHAASQARALAAKKIRVNVISPGPIYFDGGPWEKVRGSRPEMYEQALKLQPLGRMGSDVDVANAVAFLASPAAENITGTNLVVDGGFTRRFVF